MAHQQRYPRIVSEAVEIKLRTPDEVQRAHDLLWGMVTGQTEPIFDDVGQKCATAALDVLCWVLNHDHSDGFTNVMKTVEEALASRGIRLAHGSEPGIQRLPDPVFRDDDPAHDATTNEAP